MAVNRIGFSSDFTLKNQKVGVGSADPTATLDVRGAIKVTLMFLVALQDQA